MEFCQCSDASFMRDMGPKPYETRITKRPGGRHFERYGRRRCSMAAW